MSSGAALKYILRSAPVAAASGGATAVGIASLGEQSPSKRTSCESGHPTLRKRMSSAGRLATLSGMEQTACNPTHLMALVGKPFSKEDFEQLWRKRDMKERHPRFHQKVQTINSKDDEVETARYVPSQLPVESHVEDKDFPKVYNIDLQHRIESSMQSPIGAEHILWQVEVSSGGQLGQSGAIPKDRAMELMVDRKKKNLPEPAESLLLFKGHPSLADGTSLATALTDLCDEAAELKEETEKEESEAKRERKLLKWWQKLALLFQSVYYYSIGSIKAFIYYWRLYLTTSENPFQQLESLENTATHGELSISWAHVAPVEQVEQVAKSFAKNKKISINDVMVSCVSAAVARQMQEHQMRYELDGERRNSVSIPDQINIMIPIHAEGGRLRKGQTVGHRMGTLFAQVPSESTFTAFQRLQVVHDSIQQVQQTPFFLWSRLGAKVLNLFPASWVPSVLHKAQPNAACMVTHSRGPSRRIHLGGREVEVLQGFTPLTPGIPIGVVVSSYAGELNISVTAEPWAVPDAERFISWVLDEYKFLHTESPVALQTEPSSP